MEQKNVLILSMIALIGFGALLLTHEDKEMSPAKDGGKEQTLTPAASITHAHGLVVDVADPTSLYIATHHGLLVLKNDKDLYRVGNTTNDFMGFTAHPTNAKRFYASGHPATGGNLGFLSTEDGGITWKKIADGIDGPVDFHAMSMSATDTNIFYGGHEGGLQRSNDGGKTWKIVSLGESFNQLTTDPLDPLTVYGSTPSGRGIVVSHNQGATWQSLSEGLEGGVVNTLAISPHDPRIMLTSAERLGGIGNSRDGGKTWEPISERFLGETVMYIAYDKNTHGIVYALTHKNRIWKSTDNGAMWIAIR